MPDTFRWENWLVEMQAASTDEEAFAYQYRLEVSVYPNQVLTSEAPQLVAALVRGLPECSRAGRAATFESLEMIAGGCVEPFSVPEALVMATRRGLASAARDAAESQLRADGSPSSASLAAVALLGVIREFIGTDGDQDIVAAVVEYAAHGVDQAVQVGTEFPGIPAGLLRGTSGTGL